MNALTTTQNATQQWHKLITEASRHNLVQLTEEVESYLVFLLIRFVTQPEIAGSILGKEYLESAHQQSPAVQEIKLQEVGDKSLLMAGLFPSRSQRKLVKISYFVNLGINAYSTISQLSSRKSIQDLYAHLSEAFVSMMDVLQATREIEAEHYTQLNLIEACELWQDTRSRYALKTIQHYTNLPIISIMP